MTDIAAIDLTRAAALTVQLARIVNQPAVVAGGVAMMHHGRRQQPPSVEPIFARPTMLLNAAVELGLTAFKSQTGIHIRAKEGLGAQIDIPPLNVQVPELFPSAIAEAMTAQRCIKLFGSDVLVVSLGHLIAMKLVADRKQDILDIVELLKRQIMAETWGGGSQVAVNDILREQLGRYAVIRFATLEKEARYELGLMPAPPIMCRYE